MARIPSYQTTAAALPLSPSSENGISQGNRNTPISYPQVLDPEHAPQTVHRPELYFVSSSPTMSARQNSEFLQRSSTASASPISQQLYPYHQQAFHRYAPPISQPPRGVYPQYQPPPPIYPQYQAGGFNGSPPPPPALPPKPIVYPTISATPKYDLHSEPSAFEPQPPPLPPPLPPSPEDEEYVASPVDDSNELAMALALSQSESVERQKLQEELQNQEEEDLARALAESLLTTGSNLTADVNPFFASTDNQRPSSSNTAVGTPRVVPSPGHTASVYLPPESPVYLPSTHSPVPSNPNSSPLTRSAPEFPEFGRHDKWRIPGMPDNLLNGSSERTSGENFDRFGRNPSIKSSSSASRSSPPAEISRRRSSSLSSVSSLPYTRTPLGSGKLDDDDVESQRDVHDEQNGRYEPSESSAYTSPDVNSIDSHQAPSWVTSQPANLYADSEEPNVLEFDDEAYARQLAAEEEAMAAQEQQYGNEKSRPIPNYPQDVEAPLPLYTPADQPTHFSGGPSFSQHPYSLPRQSAPSSNGPYFAQNHPSHAPEYAQPTFNNGQSRSGDNIDFRLISSLTNVPRNSHFLPVVYPTLGNRNEPEPDSLSDVSHHSSVHSTTSAPPAIQPGNQTPSTSSHNDIRPPGAAPPAPAIGMMNANHFLDRELLLGVSIGFKAPAISRTLAPMQDPMPNIISLPYARCPPLHLQAPDWRHLLRLMARLSGTRIEPTVEAMAVSKTELKLRTVVQFIKPHPSVNEWRIILWFTIDHPIPPSVPGASRYLSGNPNLLPWSYTLSPVPMLLRDAADTHISKTYTIPATESVPLPNLPITFPNLALYLQAALDASRRHSNDSSGMGKLGKVVQMCYPAVEQSSEFDIPERTKMTDMFKRVMKRSNKDKKKGKATNNEETYQLVTPFVPDEWG